MTPQMFDSMVTSPEQFQQYVDTETKNWAKIIHDEHLVIE
jgi:hypothetical protein